MRDSETFVNFDRSIDLKNERDWDLWARFQTTTTPWLIEKFGNLPQFADVADSVKADEGAFGKEITLCLFEHELLSACVHKRPVNFNTYAQLNTYMREHGDVPADTLGLMINPDLMAWALQKMQVPSLREAMFKLASSARPADTVALLTDETATH